MSKVGDAIGETRASLGTVFSNANLRRLNLAFAGSAIGDWAYATAIMIWAYHVGGARAVGIYYTIRLILMTIVTPFASVLADRYSRRWVMIGTDLIRAAICMVVALLVLVEAPPLLSFALAILAAVAGTPFRPSVGALLPNLARTPTELTAANGTINTLESLAFFIGPALGGLLVTAVDVPIVIVFNALTFLWSAALVSRIATRAEAPEQAAVAAPAEAAQAPVAAPVGGAGEAGAAAEVSPSPSAEPAESEEGFVSEVLAGFRTIWQSPDLRVISGVYAAQTVVAGASVVFSVEMAVQMTTFGVTGVGYLDSAMGVGAVIGGLVAIGRATSGRLATDFGIGVMLWSLPLLLTVIWPQMWAAFLAMVIIGIANPVVDVNASTILQRSADDRVLGRVFGALDTALIGSMALGAAVMPFVVGALGLRGALAVLAVGIALAVLPAFGRFRRMNVDLREPEGLALLRGLPLFAPLDAKSLETIAGKLVRVPVAANQAVIREGEEGDRFYVIESGALTATHQGRVLSQMGPGDPFGEIALLRDVPRTATVTADVDSVLLALDRQEFLDAVTGDTEVNTRADDLISRRIPTY